MILAGIGTWVSGGALAAGSAGAVVAGGALVGAVAGGVYAASTGQNVFEGALIGGALGAFGGWAGSAMGLAGEVAQAGALGEGTAGVAAAEKNVAIKELARQKAIESGEIVAAEGMTAGEGLVTSAALQGASEAYGAKMESKAMEEIEKSKRESEERLIAARRATPAAAPMMGMKVEPSYGQQGATVTETDPGFTAAPTVAPTAPGTVGPTQVSAGFQNKMAPTFRGV